MKTIKEWLSELPDGYRERALANMEVKNENMFKDSLPKSLSSAFAWRDTPEGFDFWLHLYSFFKYQTLPPLP